MAFRTPIVAFVSFSAVRRRAPPADTPRIVVSSLATAAHKTAALAFQMKGRGAIFHRMAFASILPSLCAEPDATDGFAGCPAVLRSRFPTCDFF